MIPDITIYCNEVGCSNRYDTDMQPADPEGAELARLEAATNKGWASDGIEDWCEEHKERHKEKLWQH